MFTLPDLPYAYDALEPTMSAKTLHFHHDKHHATYVETLNTLLREAGQTPGSLEDVIRQNAGGGPGAKLFNNAAQAWNHAFFWKAMTPDGGKPSGDLDAAIRASFGGLAQLREIFVNHARRAGHRHQPGDDAPAGLRSLGARLLSGLSERPEGLPRGLVRRPAELGLRRLSAGGGERAG